MRQRRNIHFCCIKGFLLFLPESCLGSMIHLSFLLLNCHTTLKKNPSVHDMVLFLVDKLSWDQNGTPPFFDVVTSALEISLAHASLAYINFVLDNGMVLSPHRWLVDAKNWLENLD